MGRKLIIPKYSLKENTDATEAFTSDPTDCSSVDIVTYDLKINGNVIGDAYVQYCNDTRITENSEWKDLSFGEPLIFNAAIEQDYKIEMKVAFRHVRLDWAISSGTGNLDLSVYGTTVGA